MGSRPQKNIYIILVNNLVLFLGIVLLFVGLSFTILVLLVLLSRSLGFLRWGCCVLFLLLLQLFLLILAQLRGFCCGFFDFFCFVSSIHFGLLLRSIGFSVHRHWPFVAFLGHVNNFLFFFIFFLLHVILFFLLHHFTQSHIFIIIFTKKVSSEMNWALSLSEKVNGISLLEVQVQAFLFVSFVQMAKNVFWLPFVVQKKTDGILCSSTQIKSGFGDVERVLNSLRVLLARLND